MGKIVLLIVAGCFGYMVAKGDLRCRVSPDALDHLKGAVSTTVEYGEDYAHTASWGHATGEPTPLHGRDDDHFVDDLLTGKVRQ